MSAPQRKRRTPPNLSVSPSNRGVPVFPTSPRPRSPSAGRSRSPSVGRTPRQPASPRLSPRRLSPSPPLARQGSLSSPRVVSGEPELAKYLGLKRSSKIASARYADTLIAQGVDPKEALAVSRYTFYQKQLEEIKMLEEEKHKLQHEQAAIDAKIRAGQARLEVFRAQRKIAEDEEAARKAAAVEAGKRRLARGRFAGSK